MPICVASEKLSTFHLFEDLAPCRVKGGVAAAAFVNHDETATPPPDSRPSRAQDQEDSGGDHVLGGRKAMRTKKSQHMNTHGMGPAGSTQRMTVLTDTPENSRSVSAPSSNPHT